MLSVNELFQTVQGEAHHTGTPAVFVRLQGCPVACPFCDTKMTWTTHPAQEIAWADMLAKTVDAPTFARIASADLVRHLLATTRARHVVVTGGEPALYDLRDLSRGLLEAGRSVQLETSGTHAIRIHPRAWVTVSPKIDMPGGLQMREDAVTRADELKWVVGKPADIDRLQAFLARYGMSWDQVWLQPLSQSDKATALCIEAATEHGWRISVQTHKYLGVR